MENDPDDLQIEELPPGSAVESGRGPNRASVWIDRDLAGLEVMALRLDKHEFRPHTHTGLMLGLIVAGHKAFEREGRTFIAGPGSISIVNAGELHTGRRQHGAELRYFALYIPLTLLCESLGGDGNCTAPHFRAGVVQDADVYRAFAMAYRGIVGNESRLARESFLAVATSLLAGRYGDRGKQAQRSSKSPEPSAVRRARDFIAARFADDLSIDAIAVEARLSRFHLMREFRVHVGLPMHAYQLQLRIEHAKTRLAAGEPVVAVALDLGFADQAHFSKRFRDLVGVAPARYRRHASRSLTRDFHSLSASCG